MKNLALLALFAGALIGLAGSTPLARAESTPDPWASPVPAPIASPTPTAEPAAPEAPARTGKGGALFIGVAPVYLPKFASSDRLNSGNLLTYDIGFEAPAHNFVSLRYAKATVPSLQVYDTSAFTTTYSTNASLTMLELLTGGNIPLGLPYTNLGPFQLFLPLQFGTAFLALNGSGGSYQAVAFDTAIGFGARFYTPSVFRADVSALYHFGIPLSTISGGASSDVQDPAGEAMKASMTGIEIRLGISLLFSDPPGETQK